MRVPVILAMGFLVGFGVANAGSATGDAGAAKAKNCTGCHNAKIDLKGRGAEKIACQTKAIRAGDKAHPPGLAELTDEDIALIAEYLDGA